MIFEAANDLGLNTHEYMWIFTRSVITSQLYSNFKYKNFSNNSKKQKIKHCEKNDKIEFISKTGENFDQNLQMYYFLKVKFLKVKIF